MYITKATKLIQFPVQSLGMVCFISLVGCRRAETLALHVLWGTLRRRPIYIMLAIHRYTHKCRDYIALQRGLSRNC